MLLQGPIWAGLLLSSALASKVAPDTENDATKLVPVEDVLVEIPGVDPPVEVHQVFLTVQDLATRKESPRHTQEKNVLLGRLDRGHGTWGPNHPRHRLLDSLYGFQNYFDRNMEDLNRLKKLYKNVSRQQKKLVESTIQYSSKFSKVEHLLAENHRLCQRIVDTALDFYGVERSELDDHIKTAEKNGKVAEKVSVSQALKHVVRDWSAEGLGERKDAFPCLLETLDGLFPDREGAKGLAKILLPGAGLGRLGHELSGLGGFEITSNEWSMYMNVMYRFLEEHTATAAESVYPFVDYWSHHVSNADMLRKVSFPDTPVNGSAVLLVEGDFTTVFQDKAGYFDAIVTHFFIDTARNIISYFDTIHKLLPPGGYWINFGPLLYGTAPFVQLSLEEIIAVAEAMGFELLDTPDKWGGLTTEGGKVRGWEAVYGFNERALTKNAYQSQFWIARKRA
ncbi:related to putative trehalase [Cephalotrichum gorgonifer]|uniref:Related to putative trehalase n=1 Tax=Cephalotrichum gorgonifer TaxID=2041049 RepID=A0AAE8MYA7_9PEZI|nr:related to putative trehalase [Cephalotrichum gorgonifer]